jgi:hypothetical protein
MAMESMLMPQKTNYVTTIQSSNTTVGLIHSVPGCNRNTFTPVFIAALSTIVKLWKQPDSPHLNNGLRKCGIYTQQTIVYKSDWLVWMI